MAERSSGFELPCRIILPVCIAASGALLFFRTLITDRPAIRAGGEQSIGVADVAARLWQDPFRAIEDAPVERPPLTCCCSQPSTPGRDRNAELVQSIRERTVTFDEHHTPQPADVLVLPVLVPGSAYAEFAEQRLRTRVAVLSGLARCGYNPEDTTHIGYFERPVPVRRLDGPIDYVTPLDESQAVSMKIPYEWLRPASVPMPINGLNAKAAQQPSQPQYNNILVLWLNEDMLLDRPIYRMGYLFNRLFHDVKFGAQKPTVPKPDELDVSKLQMRIIGPRTSTALRAMAWEQGHFREHPFPTCLIFICPTATAEVDALLDGLPRTPNDNKESTEADLNRYLNQALGYDQVRLLRVTPSDQQVCSTLVQELQIRGLKISRDPTADHPDDDAVAVVAEWDTFFGRALSLSFASAYSGKKVSELSDRPQDYPSHVYPFVYLRGLDGQTAASAADAKDVKSAGDKSDGDKGSDRVFRPSDGPEGPNQSDYLRRLADQLAELDARLRHEGKRLKAVGVLGTDLYDKLMILRALRPELKGVIFFTTDLDARYALPSEWDNTHNLVIASGFGQRLAKFYQGGIPPFRDSGQTATYAATLAAAWPDPTSATGTPAVAVLPIPLAADKTQSAAAAPRLFEIARDGPYDFSSGSSYTESLSGPEVDGSPVAVQPSRINPTNWFDQRGLYALQFATAALVAAGVLIALRWKNIPKLRRPKAFLADFGEGCWRAAKNGYLFSGALLLIAILLAWWISSYTAEPFSFVNGISAWPTEISRILAISLIWYFAFRTEPQRLANNIEIERLFGFLENAPPGTVSEPAPGHVSAAVIWQTYKTASGASNPGIDSSDYSLRQFGNAAWGMVRSERFGLSVLLAFAYVIAAEAVIHATGTPFAPIRGVVANCVDFILMAALTVSLTFYVIFVLLSSVTVYRFIAKLMPDPTEYPPGAARRVFANVLGRSEPLSPQDEEKQIAAEEDFADAMDIRLIAMRTRVIGRSVYHLLFVLGLVLVGRSTLFDDWDWPIGLVIVFAITGVIAIAIAVSLREAAENARRKALRLLEAQRLRHLICDRPDRAAVLERIIESVENEGDGAFKVLSQYRWLNALLVPSGGLGAWVLLEYLPQWLH